MMFVYCLKLDSRSFILFHNKSFVLFDVRLEIFLENDVIDDCVCFHENSTLDDCIFFTV